MNKFNLLHDENRDNMIDVYHNKMFESLDYMSHSTNHLY